MTRAHRASVFRAPSPRCRPPASTHGLRVTCAGDMSISALACGRVSSWPITTRPPSISKWRKRVVAPFAGVITARNVDAGTLVGTAGGVSGTLTAATGSAPGSLFTLVQTDTLSVYVTVPEDNAAAVAIGKPAVVTVPALPGDTLLGRVARTAGALDATARTLLTEVRVANPTGVFLPGMYAQVRLALGAGAPPLRVPAT